MKVKGGYLIGTQSLRMHPIKNIQVASSDKWNRITIKAFKDIITIGNTYNSVLIGIKQLSNYNIGLVVNDRIHFEHPNIFEFEVEIDCEDESIIKIINDNIYDG